MTPYDPEPLDTSGVTLSPALAALLERLAENTHEVWAVDKMHSQGYRYGPVTDDAAKTHRLLVPYARLTEAEKEQDRKTARETLKAILLLGYAITDPA